MKQAFEILRHAEKSSTGSLSERGRAEVVDRARVYFEEIKNYPDGTIVAFMPSNIGRTQETRDLFERELTELFRQEGSGYQVISVNDISSINSINKDTPGKILVTGLAPSSRIGFNTKEGNRQGIEFIRRQKDFQGEEALIGKLWAATAEELPRVREEIADKHPQVAIADIKPSNFYDTPEEAALPQLRFMLRMLAISREHFPENPFKLFGVSHNIITDFLTMKLLGQPINTSTIESWGGQTRQYLESHCVDIEDGKVVVSFRGQQREFTELELNNCVQELVKESEDRKKLWQENNI